jgi:hypothetical protein
LALRKITKRPTCRPPSYATGASPAPVFDHRNIEFKGEHSSSHSYRVLPMDRIKNLAMHFPEEFVADLKSRVGARCSTFQCLLAHVWKKVTTARDLAPDDFTQVRVAVNCRSRAKPPMPMDFFGNMVLWAFPRMQVRDLLSSSYPVVVGAIREAVARVDDEYIQSFVDYGRRIEDGGQELAPILRRLRWVRYFARTWRWTAGSGSASTTSTLAAARHARSFRRTCPSME